MKITHVLPTTFALLILNSCEKEGNNAPSQPESAENTAFRFNTTWTSYMQLIGPEFIGRLLNKISDVHQPGPYGTTHYISYKISNP